MSRRRILGIGALVAVVALALVAGVALKMALDFGERMHRLWDEGLLGPEDQRQRVETTHGLAISIPGDWTTEDPPPDPDAEERLGLRAVLTLHSRAGDPVCHVHLAAGAAPHWVIEDGRWADGDASLGEQLLGPWLAERGIRPGEWGEASSGPWRDDMAGLSFDDGRGLTGAAWVIAGTEDLYVLTCTWTPGSDEEPGPEWWGNPDLLRIAMGPMAESVESLPEE